MVTDVNTGNRQDGNYSAWSLRRVTMKKLWVLGRSGVGACWELTEPAGFLFTLTGIQLCVCPSLSVGVPSPPPSAGLLSSFSQDPSSSASSLPLGFYHLPPFSPPPLSLSPAFLSLSTPPPPSFSFFLPYFFSTFFPIFLSIYLFLALCNSCYMFLGPTMFFLNSFHLF